MRFVIVTGMSGGGKSTAMKMLEDAGYYCADNMPVPLIEKFMELLAMPDNGILKVALGLDVRADQSFEDVNQLIARLRETYTFEILFLEAADSVLLKRYKESRRVHPLSVDGDLMSGITRERALLASIKQAADYVIDTTNLLTRELKAELDRIFVSNQAYNSLMVNVMSTFGIELQEVHIHRLRNGVFAAELLLKNEYGEQIIDSRSSDAIALAIRVDAPIYTTPEVLEEAGFEPGERNGNDNNGDDTKSTETRNRPKGKDDYTRKSVEELKAMMQKAAESENYEEAGRIKRELDRRSAE